MSYKPLTLKSIKELAAPRTWPAGILPVLLAGALSFTLYQAFPLVLFVLLLLISILLQSAVNTLNDYFDFVKGTDREENSLDETDASIIYNHINPKAALATGLVFLGLAVGGGLCLALRCGWPLLLLGFAGVAAVYLYSGGPCPLSYWPVGELISGLMMGGLLLLAGIFALSGKLSLGDLYFGAPLIIGIGLILLTNNTCDIEKDIPAGRRTLPVLLGRKLSARLLFFGFVFVLLAVAHISFYSFRSGLWLMLPLLVHSSFYLVPMWRMTYTAKERRGAMKTTLVLTTITGGYYIIMVLWEGFFSG